MRIIRITSYVCLYNITDKITAILTTKLIIANNNFIINQGINKN